MLYSCNDDTNIENEEELITTLIYKLKPANGGNELTFKFQDLDGDGGKAPTVTVDKLKANTTYEGTISMLNEAENPVEDITQEVKDEAEDHQFFYESNIGSVTYNDKDTNNNPIGLSTKLTTSSAKAGTLKIVLRHLPIKNGAGVKDGVITNAGGETDIEVTFNVTIE